MANWMQGPFPGLFPSAERPRHMPATREPTRATSAALAVSTRKESSLFTSVPLKTQARNLGRLFEDRGIKLSRNEMLEALAAVHGASNWQTLRTLEKGHARPEPRSEAGPWTLSSDGIFDRASEQFNDLNAAVAAASERVKLGRECLVWAQHANGRTVCAAVQAPDVPETALAEQASVLLLDGSAAVWSIENYLSDRWGNLNDHGLDYKPSLSEVTAELWTRLADQLVDETSFIARLDDEWGVLLEIELQCHDSDPDAEGLTAKDTFDAVTESIRLRLNELGVEKTFSGVRFGLVQGEGLINGRPGVWAFVRDGLLSSSERTALGDLLLTL